MGWFDRVHMYVSISLIPRLPCHMGTWERGYVSIYGQLTSTDEDGPEICEPDSNRLTCTGGNNDANRRCGTRAICTAACNCWDGTMNRTTNTQRFTDSTIEGQGNMIVVWQYDVTTVSFPGHAHRLGNYKYTVCQGCSN